MRSSICGGDQKRRAPIGSFSPATLRSSGTLQSRFWHLRYTPKYARARRYYSPSTYNLYRGLNFWLLPIDFPKNFILFSCRQYAIFRQLMLGLNQVLVCSEWLLKNDLNHLEGSSSISSSDTQSLCTLWLFSPSATLYGRLWSPVTWRCLCAFTSLLVFFPMSPMTEIQHIVVGLS